MKKNDILIVILCLTASVLSGSAFWKEYTRTLSKLNETPIGTIIYKKRTTQRKFIDRVVWDMLKQKSDVYNADTIRTINASEAVVLFKDEITQITMNANTLIQIFYNDNYGAKIDFFSGNIEVNSGAEGIVITSGSSEIFVAGAANLNKKDQGFSLSVTEGEAVLDGEKIESGEMLILDENGERNLLPAITITSLSTSTRVIRAQGEATPVVFEWNSYNFDSGTYVIIETAIDPSFNRIAQSIEAEESTSATLYIDNALLNQSGGEYFWRAYPARSGSRESANTMYPQGTLEIIPNTEVKLILPENAFETTAENDTAVSFSWTETPGAAAYTLEISADTNMANPAIARRIEGTRVMQTGLSAGVWYWRVTPVLHNRVIGALPPSETRSFKLVLPVPPVQQTAATPAPAAAREPAPNELARSYIDRGWSFFGQGNHAAAVAEFSEAIRLNPNSAEMYSSRGSAYRELARATGNKSDLDRAFEDFNRAIQLDPNYEGGHGGLGSAYLLQYQYMNRNIDVLDRALEAVNRAIQLEPLTWNYGTRGSIYYEKGEYDRAITNFTESIRLHPNNHDAYIGRAHAYLKKGDNDRAFADFNQAIRIAPNVTYIYVNRGNAYKEIGNTNRAIEDYERAIKLNPNDSWACSCLASVYLDLGWAGSKDDFDRAISLLNQVIQLNPNYIWNYNTRGWAYLGRSDNDPQASIFIDRALENFETMLRMDPNSGDAIRGIGEVTKRRGDINRALELFDTALRLNPNMPHGYMNRGSIYMERGDYDRAIADYTMAINIESDAWYYRDRGWAYYYRNRQGDDDRALTDFTEGLRLEPNYSYNADVYSGIGQVYYYRKQDYDRAIEAFENAVRLKPDNEWFKEMLELAHRRGS